MYLLYVARHLGWASHGFVVKPRGRIYARKLRVIEGVIYLPAQLQEPPFAKERNILEERNIPIMRTGQTEDVFRRVAKITFGWIRHGSGIDPLDGAQQTAAERDLLPIKCRRIAHQ